MKNLIRLLFSGLWSALNTLRRVLHLLLLLLIFGVLMAGLSGPAPERPSHGAALLVDPYGELVEQLSGDPIDRVLGELQGDGIRQVLLRDLVESLESAAEDERIAAVVLRLENFEGGSLPAMRRLAAAIDGVREAGKKVIALGDSFDQRQYYIAAHADEIYLNDLGVVYIDGLGYYRTFFKTALEKLHVDLNVFRVGEYKSFVEPFIRDDMSKEDRQASGQWLRAMWAAFQRDVVGARGLAAGALDDYANHFPDWLDAAAGSASTVALEQRLVDGLMGRQQFAEYMGGLVGHGSDRGAAGFNSVDYRSYHRYIRKTRPQQSGSRKVGVIVASGQIIDGRADPGEVGGDTLASLARQALEDDSIKAVVLRVDSPGGSMFASEVALDAMRTLKASGKPLIVSMGGLAASGGYYISMAADEIWADEATITGSIGVGALVPTVDRSLDALGIHVDGFGTTRLSGQLRLDRPLGDDAQRMLQQSVEDAYRTFVEGVAEARHLSFERVDAIARGRVWVGADARDLGLVDSLGNLDDAVAAAAARAGLAEGEYGLRYIEPSLSLPARLIEQYMVRLLARLEPLVGSRLQMGGPLARLRHAAKHELRVLDALNDPRGIYMLCSCETD